MCTQCNTNHFTSEEDAAILDAIEYGHLSHARVQRLLKSSYAKAAIFVSTAIKLGYFDETQHPVITKSEYQRITENKIGILPPRQRSGAGVSENN